MNFSFFLLLFLIYEKIIRYESFKKVNTNILSKYNVGAFAIKHLLAFLTKILKFLQIKMF